MFRKHQTKGRFTVERVGAKGEGWNVIDNLDASCLVWDTKSEAEMEATFCRTYVKKWGDIDLNCYPMNLGTPLTYVDETERDWNKDKH
jgi:hypothetical protein